jgi:ureidoacrylate peracid hydrolase
MDLANTALIVVDLQNALCSRRGSYRRRGKTVLNMGTLLKNIKKLLDLFRGKKLPVIFIRIVFKGDYSDAGLLPKKAPEIVKVKAYREGSWDSAIVKDAQPRPGEAVVVKKRYDSFENTGLERILRKKGIRKLIVAGVLTNVCVESLVRSAFDKGFEPIVIKDATSSYSKKLHTASLETMERHFAEVLSSAEFLSCFV